MNTTPRNNSSSLRRALSLLDALVAAAASGNGCSLPELAEFAGSSKSTVLRLLAPLIEASLVQQGSDGRYRVGVGAVSLGSAYLNNLDLRSVAQPVLHQLAAAAEETVHLLVYSNGQVVYVDKIAGPSPIQMASRVGDRVAVHSTASGKAILANLPVAEFDRVVAAGLPARTSNTIVSAQALAADLDLTRRRGFGLDDIENEEGIRCLAAPVFDHIGSVVAAVSVSGPADRMAAKLDELAELIVSAAAQISRALGSHHRRPNTDPALLHQQ